MSKKPEIPSPPEHSQELRGNIGIRDEQLRLLATEEAEINEIRKRLRDDRRSKAEAERDSRIARLIGREAPSADHARLALLEQSVSDRHAALKILETEIRRLNIVASKEIGEKLKPWHSQLVKGICESLISLNERMSAYEDFVREMERKNIAVLSAIRPMRATFAGRSNDADSKIGRYIHEAVEFQIVSPNIIPSTLRRQ